MIHKDNCKVLAQFDEGEVVIVNPMSQAVLKYFIDHLFKQSCRTEGGLSSYPGDVTVHRLIYTSVHDVILKMTIGGDEYNLITNIATKFRRGRYCSFILYKEEDGIGELDHNRYQITDIAAMIGLTYILLDHQPTTKG